MTINKTIDNKVYSIPETGSRDWGEDVTELLAKLADVSLQIDGQKQSARPLTADADFGSSFGLIVKYLKSKTGTVSTAGVVRLNKADFIAWRNNANSANLALGVDASNRLTFGGVVIPTASSSDVLTGKTIDADDNTILDLTLANLKTGVVSSNLATSATSSQIPRADAAKSYTDSQVAAEAATRLAADNAEASARAAADSAEQSARIAADSAETAARIAADALKVSKAGDSMTGPLAMGGNKITGLADPTSNQEAATKFYVDSAAAGGATKVSKAGDSMTGNLDMQTNLVVGLGAPINPNDATRKTYVDAADALKVNKAGDTMSGALDLGSNKITSLATPTVGSDAANKTYVDTKQATSEKGVANGYASLDSGGKVPVAQLPNSIMEYKGTYNASTNTPTLVDGVGDTGDCYRVTVAGAGVNSLNFVVGDYAIYNGSAWEKAHSGADAVTSVDGRAGVVTLNDLYQPLDSDLTAVAALTTTGIIVRTGTGTAATRTLQAGSTKVSITNPAGLAGDPSIDVVEANLSLNNIGGTLSASKGGTGQTSAVNAYNAFVDSVTGTPAKGDIFVRGSTVMIRVPVGADGTVLTADSTQASGVKWGTALSNPMTSTGDMIYGGAAGAATRLPAGTSGAVLRSGGAAIPVWDTNLSVDPTVGKTTIGPTAGLGSGAAAYHIEYGAHINRLTSASSFGQDSAPMQYRMAANYYLDAAGAAKAVTTGGLGYFNIEGRTVGTDIVFTWATNTTSQTADTAITGTTNTIGTATAAGAFTFGTATSDVQHLIRNSSTSVQTLQLRNHNTTTSSDGVAGLYILKGSTTNTAGTNEFVRFAINAGGTLSGIIASNGANAAAFFNASDRRIKQDVQPLTGALSVISQLNPVEYKYKADGSKGISFIAQEMAEVLPHLVRKTDDGTGSDVPEDKDPWSVTETGLAPYIIAAMKEQQSLIEQLKARIDALESIK